MHVSFLIRCVIAVFNHIVKVVRSKQW